MSINKENSKFEITLVYYSKTIKIYKATGGSLPEALAQFLFCVERTMVDIHGEEHAARIEATSDDDIPF